MVGGYIYEIGEGWVAGVHGGEGDEVGWEVNIHMYNICICELMS